MPRWRKRKASRSEVERREVRVVELVEHLLCRLEGQSEEVAPVDAKDLTAGGDAERTRVRIGHHVADADGVGAVLIGAPLETDAQRQVAVRIDHKLLLLEGPRGNGLAAIGACTPRTG